MLPQFVAIAFGQQKNTKRRDYATYSYTMLHQATNNYYTMSSNMRINKTCQYCNKPFVARKTTSICCSDHCSKRAYKKRKRDEKIAKVVEAQNQPFNPVVQEKEFLSIKDVCMLLGASRWTIYRLIDKGELNVAKIGNRTIVRRNEIDKLFNTQTQ